MYDKAKRVGVQSTVCVNLKLVNSEPKLFIFFYPEAISSKAEALGGSFLFQQEHVSQINKKDNHWLLDGILNIPSDSFVIEFTVFKIQLAHEI